MARRHYNLPPLSTLTTFETAARKGSFKEAAAELSVTPGAVSHQIKALENELGQKLFDRQHRSVVLTHAGQQLFTGLGRAFRDISDTLETLRSDTNQAVTIGATTSMAALWLSPALLSFWRSHPSVTVHQTVRDMPFALSPELDCYIWYGAPPERGTESFHLFHDHLLPVAHPDLAQELGNLSLEALAAQRLIHQVGDHLSWSRWQDWFAQMGYAGAIAPGLRVNNYAIALQAAQDGVGIALGWQNLISPLLESGKLAPVGTHRRQADAPFQLICKPDARLSENARRLRDWLVERA